MPQDEIKKNAIMTYLMGVVLDEMSNNYTVLKLCLTLGHFLISGG